MLMPDPNATLHAMLDADEFVTSLRREHRFPTRLTPGSARSWENVDAWTIDQALTLTFDLDPTALQVPFLAAIGALHSPISQSEADDTQQLVDTLIAAAHRASRLLHLAIETGKLASVPVVPSSPGLPPIESGWSGSSDEHGGSQAREVAPALVHTVSPRAFANWVRGKEGVSYPRLAPVLRTALSLGALSLDERLDRAQKSRRRLIRLLDNSRRNKYEADGRVLPRVLAVLAAVAEAKFGFTQDHNAIGSAVRILESLDTASVRNPVGKVTLRKYLMVGSDKLHDRALRWHILDQSARKQ